MSYGSDEEDGGEGEESDGGDEGEVLEAQSGGRRDSKDLAPHDGEVRKKPSHRRRKSKGKENSGAVKR